LTLFNSRDTLFTMSETEFLVRQMREAYYAYAEAVGNQAKAEIDLKNSTDKKGYETVETRLENAKLHRKLTEETFQSRLYQLHLYMKVAKGIQHM
jgi:hypothetical protein